MAINSKIAAVVVFSSLLFVSQASLQVFAQGNSGSGSPEVSSWVTAMHETPDPSVGCFQAVYPSMVWVETACNPENMTTSASPPEVGNGVDYSGFDGGSPYGTYIGFADGVFSSISGITTEVDNTSSNCGALGTCTNYYSLQVNTEVLPTTWDTYCPGYSNYNGYRSGYQCWEQFVMRASGTSPAYLFIEYALIGYASSHGGCVSTTGGTLATPPSTNSFGWTNYKGSCYAETSDYYLNFAEPASNLGHLSFSGSSAFAGSSYDQTTLCDSSQSPSCYSTSNQDSIFSLYKIWGTAEFNIFGFGGGSQAVLGGTSSSGSLSIDLNEETDTGSQITPTCDSTGFTGETNSLGLNSNSCTYTSFGYMTFSESGYYLTMQSNSGGTVAPLSGYYGGTVKIDATANSGYYFSKWTGSCSTGCNGYYSGTNNPATVTMNGPITEYATFG